MGHEQYCGSSSDVDVGVWLRRTHDGASATSNEHSYGFCPNPTYTLAWYTLIPKIQLEVVRLLKGSKCGSLATWVCVEPEI